MKIHAAAKSYFVVALVGWESPHSYVPQLRYVDEKRNLGAGHRVDEPRALRIFAQRLLQGAQKSSATKGVIRNSRSTMAEAETKLISNFRVIVIKSN